MAKRKLDYAVAGADGQALTCPFCVIMANPRRIEELFETEYKLPVLYYPQLLGLAMGFSLEEMGVKLNRVKPRRLTRALMR